VKRADSLNRKDIRDALAATKNFHGVTGDITFDKNGDPVNKSAAILKFENHGSVYYKSVQP
ncbi:MAG: ethanolamine utilization protein EutJ, partial [Thermodesulfobacteriota bacterium]|nr:ethanolamine utilization protein EutJ [Thermodesulfobacteriota bacterium]